PRGVPPRLSPLPPRLPSSPLLLSPPVLLRASGLLRCRRRGTFPVPVPVSVPLSRLLSAGGRGECPAGLRPDAAAVLVLLPGIPALLSVRQRVPGRLAPGGPASESTAVLLTRWSSQRSSSQRLRAGDPPSRRRGALTVGPRHPRPPRCRRRRP